MLVTASQDDGWFSEEAIKLAACLRQTASHAYYLVKVEKLLMKVAFKRVLYCARLKKLSVGRQPSILQLGLIW